MSRTTTHNPPQNAPDSNQVHAVRSQPTADNFAHQRIEAMIRGVCLLAVLVWALTLLLVLSGCGPGTGGTGVGPVTSSTVSVAYSGATTVATPPTLTTTAPVTVPGPTVAPAVPAPVPGVPGVPGVVPPPTGVACTVNCAASTVTLQLEADRVVLLGSCFNFTSQAPLNVSANGPTVLAGSYQKFSNQGGQVVTSSTPANLFLQFANGQSDSSSVTLSVRDTAGSVLFGPVTLPRALATPSGGGLPAISPAAGSNTSTCL